MEVMIGLMTASVVLSACGGTSQFGAATTTSNSAADGGDVCTDAAMADTPISNAADVIATIRPDFRNCYNTASRPILIGGGTNQLRHIG